MAARTGRVRIHSQKDQIGLQCAVIRPANLIDALNCAPGGRNFITFWVDEDEEESVTFGEFRQRALLESEWLAQEGVSAGDRLVIIMPQGIPAMVTFAAAMMLGAVPAFLAYPNFKVEPSKYRSGLAGVTANLSAKAVVIDAEFPDEMLGSVTLSDGTKLLRPAPHVGYEPSEENAQEHPAIDCHTLAFIQHSAGTTGLQKGVALSHAAVLRQLDYLAAALKIDGVTDRIYSWLPLYHDMGLIACFMLPMAYHVPIVMQSPLDWVMQPESMLQIVAQHKCTLAWMPNFAFQFVPRRVPQSRWSAYDLSSLRLLINCSEPVRASSMTELQKAFSLSPHVLQSSYAMAENVFAVTQSDITRGPATLWAEAQPFRSAHRIVLANEKSPSAIPFTSSGRLLPNQQVRIVSDDGAILERDCVGEILIQSDCLFDGYYNRPDLTANAIIDGWYHTGDLGFCRDGELYVVGRKKDLLIVGGENIYPQDIEEIVASHPAIHDGRAVAMGLYNPELGTEDIVMVAEVESEAALSNATELEQEIRSRIVAGLGIAVRTIILKPPKWIVKSTAGKAARSATREKLLREHPELQAEGQVSV
ncbi:MAG TPA: AMP-binding protein [Verrucomicrobiae bacterium]|nr:AMP-binding protein [Verrucomicrobiae bacterium]